MNHVRWHREYGSNNDIRCVDDLSRNKTSLSLDRFEKIYRRSVLREDGVKKRGNSSFAFFPRKQRSRTKNKFTTTSFHHLTVIYLSCIRFTYNNFCFSASLFFRLESVLYINKIREAKKNAGSCVTQLV